MHQLRAIDTVGSELDFEGGVQVIHSGGWKHLIKRDHKMNIELIHLGR